MLTRLLAGALLLFGCCPAQDNQVITLPAPPPTAPGQPVYTAQPAYASQPADAPRAKAETASAGGPVGLIYKATSGANTVYLVGSMHFGSADMYPLPATIESAFRSSSVLAVEIDVRRINPMQAMNLIMGQGTYPPGDTLWNHMSSHTRSLLTAFWEKRGINPELFSRSKLWAVDVILAGQMAESSGLRPDLGIDSHFLQEAGSGMRVDELESADAQIRAVSQTPEREQERSLLEALENPDRARQQFGAMKAAWLSGDAPALEALISSGFAESADARKTLLTDRNASMAAAVERYLKGNQRCFAVVGAGHIVGRDGIVSLLERKGYAVKQVLPAK